MPLTKPANLSGVMLAQQYYAPGSDQNWSTTSSSDADVNATNAAITFTTPANGAVWVCASFYATTGTGTVMDAGLREASSTVAGTTCRVIYNQAGPTQLRASYRVKVTGLTPGDVHTYKLGFARALGSGACEIHAGPTLGSFSMWIEGV